MKKILLLLFLFPSLSEAQTIVKKSKVILSIGSGTHPIQIDRDIIQGDTLYSFIFRNRKYETLTDVKNMRLKKSDLLSLSKGFSEAQSAGMGDNVMMTDFSITKEKLALGGAQYWLRYDNGYCYLSEKEVKKLLSAIHSEQ